ncbi:MAG: SDR family oxidoreductase [Gammaproteobacteria bacterium]|nr:SDR family oxidoreductase [Gammaproteobacteria bacterium]
MRVILYGMVFLLTLVTGCANTASKQTHVTDASQGSQGVVLVAGATGRTGRLIVNALLQQGHSVRAFVRNPDKAANLFGDRVEIATGDVKDKASINKAMHGVQWVFSAIGSSGSKDPSNYPQYVDFEGTRNLAEAAAEAKVKQFIMVSSRSAGKKDHMLNKRFHNVLIWKLKGENALRGSGVPYTIVRPGGLRDQPGGQHKLVAFSPEHGQSKLRMVSRTDVAAVCVAALNNADAFNKTIALVSDPDLPAQPVDTIFKSIPVDQGQY